MVHRRALFRGWQTKLKIQNDLSHEDPWMRSGDTYIMNEYECLQAQIGVSCVYITVVLYLKLIFYNRSRFSKWTCNQHGQGFKLEWFWMFPKIRRTFHITKQGVGKPSHIAPTTFYYYYYSIMIWLIEHSLNKYCLDL